jgi:hypothetical protein
MFCKRSLNLLAQASLFLMRELCGLNGDVSVAGGYVLPAGVLPELLAHMSRGVLEVYRKVFGLPSETEHAGLEAPATMPQVAALQAILDLQYMSDVLAGRSSTKDASEHQVYERRLQETLRAVRDLVDPFDLDVLSPHLEQARVRLYQRTALLLGNLTSLASLHTSVLPSSATEQHNTLALASVAPRFALLPMSSAGASSAVAPLGTAAAALAASATDVDLSRVFTLLAAPLDIAQ